MWANKPYYSHMKNDNNQIETLKTVAGKAADQLSALIPSNNPLNISDEGIASIANLVTELKKAISGK